MVQVKFENLKSKTRHVLTLSDLCITFKHSGRHMALSHLVTLSIFSLRNLDIGANNSMIELIDFMMQLFLLGVTQHALQSYIEIIRKYHNHTPQTNPWHREEEQQNIYSNNTSVRQ